MYLTFDLVQRFLAAWRHDSTVTDEQRKLKDIDGGQIDGRRQDSSKEVKNSICPVAVGK